MKKDIMEVVEQLHLVPLSKGYRLNDFQCTVDTYTDFLRNYALKFQEMNISKTHLVINKQNADIIAYIVLLSDMIKLSDDERNDSKMDLIPFTSFPVLKIGQMAVSEEYQEKYKGVGSLLIRITKGFANDMNYSGIACKFITVDADIENNPGVDLFYKKQGFKYNDFPEYRKRTKKLSMRLTLYE